MSDTRPPLFKFPACRLWERTGRDGKPFLSGRARFSDTPADGAGSLNNSPNLAENETMVGHYPPGVYRLIADEIGVHVVRRDPGGITADAGPPSVAAIQAANERYWRRRSGRK